MTDAYGRDLFECPGCQIQANLTKKEVSGWINRHVEESPDCLPAIQKALAAKAK